MDTNLICLIMPVRDYFRSLVLRLKDYGYDSKMQIRQNSISVDTDDESAFLDSLNRKQAASLLLHERSKHFASLIMQFRYLEDAEGIVSVVSIMDEARLIERNPLHISLIDIMRADKIYFTDCYLDIDSVNNHYDFDNKIFYSKTIILKVGQEVILPRYETLSQCERFNLDKIDYALFRLAKDADINTSNQSMPH